MKVRSNKIKDIQNHYKRRLQQIYPGEEASKLMEILFDELLGISRLQIISEPEKRLSESEMLRIHFGVKKLINHTPVQHITGKAYFYGLEITVNEHVLIPRPETEELVEWVLNCAKAIPKIKLLDIGTGSGAIAIALKKAEPSWDVTAIDFSKPALDIARKNADAYHQEISFLEVDIFDTTARTTFPVFDVIVSNPPYVTGSDKKQMQPNVLNFEPGSALYVSDKDPLIFYREILEFAEEHLNEQGRIFFEINERFGEAMEQLLLGYGFSHIELKKDLHGKDRMCSGVKIC